MKKTMIALFVLGGLSGAATAQTYAQQGDPFGSDRGAQNQAPRAMTLDTLTLAQCDAGYQQGMQFTKQQFDTHCSALKASK